MPAICNNVFLRRSLGLANIPRLMAVCNRQISSKEIIEREKKVIANNYESLPVVICKGQGKSLF